MSLLVASAEHRQTFDQVQTPDTKKESLGTRDSEVNQSVFAALILQTGEFGSACVNIVLNLNLKRASIVKVDRR